MSANSDYINYSGSWERNKNGATDRTLLDKTPLFPGEIDYDLGAIGTGLPLKKQALQSSNALAPFYSTLATEAYGGLSDPSWVEFECSVSYFSTGAAAASNVALRAVIYNEDGTLVAKNPTSGYYAIPAFTGLVANGDTNPIVSNWIAIHLERGQYVYPFFDYVGIDAAFEFRIVRLSMSCDTPVPANLSRFIRQLD